MTKSNCFRLASLLVLAASTALSAAAQSTVVYTGGNDLVVKGADGKLLNFIVPAGLKFTAGDKQLTLAELKPGTKITKHIDTGADPAVVTSITVVKGKVYGITPPDGVTLSLAAGTKDYVVPDGTSFMVDGKKLAIAELKPGMMVEATIVTTAAPDAAASTPPAAPALVGTLLVEHTGGEGDLPAAGTTLPLYGFLGAACLGLGLVLLNLRKPVRQS